MATPTIKAKNHIVCQRPGWLLRSCDKCGGDLRLIYEDGEYIYWCLQCGKYRQIELTLSEKRQLCGTLGGQTTFSRYGSNHMSRLSLQRRHKRGRPRLPSLDELRHQSAGNSNKEAELPASLRELKRLYSMRNNGRGELPQLTPKETTK